MKKIFLFLALLSAINIPILQAMHGEAGPSQANPPSYGDVMAEDLIAQLSKVSDKSAGAEMIAELESMKPQVTYPVRVKIDQAIEKYKKRTGQQDRTINEIHNLMTPEEKTALSRLYETREKQKKQLQSTVNPSKRMRLKEEIDWTNFEINKLILKFEEKYGKGKTR